MQKTRPTAEMSDSPRRLAIDLLRHLLGVAFVAIVMSPPAHADGKQRPTLQEVLLLGKFNGNCGMLRQLADFQKTANIAGADELLSRFTVAEAERLGCTTADYIERCQRAAAVYNYIWDESGKMNDPTDPGKGAQ
ncbi:MAG TPA: hypothetical protein VEC35_22155 [Noviherbaspirillum sp.]|nr:hypothetical protein [Noviherbaspirillum sp.]